MNDRLLLYTDVDIASLRLEAGQVMEIRGRENRHLQLSVLLTIIRPTAEYKEPLLWFKGYIGDQQSHSTELYKGVIHTDEGNIAMIANDTPALLAYHAITGKREVTQVPCGAD